MNPLLSEFDTPFNVPPFNKIKNEHYIPAFEFGIKELQKDIKKITDNTDKPTFENTIVAIDNCGMTISKVSSIFYALLSSNTSPELQEIAKIISPKLTKESDNLLLNEALYSRVKYVYENKEKFNLNTEQNSLLKETYNDFVRGGADLNKEDKAKLRDINEKLSVLTIQFGENQLNDINAFQLVIDDKDDLAGLPQSIIDAAYERGTEKGQEGKWIFTVQKPSLIPFLQYSEKRELREELFKGYTKLGDNDNRNDNKHIINEIVNLRLEKANLLGYNSYAAYILDNNMAKTPEKVYELINRIFNAALPNAKEEVKELQAIIDKDNGGFKLAPWDWWYYAEKLKKEKYTLHEEELRPYFQLDNVINGVFDVANKLYGISFTPRTDIPTYHKDVRTYEVKEKNGSHIAILYMDFYPRESKRSGAWMGSFRQHSKRKGILQTPVITTVFNFPKPTKDSPSLLSLEEVETLFHEFGHALHGMLSKCTYYKLTGTSVARDFVELPSQIMENWALSPEVLRMYAKHYKTGKVIPDELIEKIQKSMLFNQGFETVELLSAALLDMAWHTITKHQDFDVNAFEKAALDKIGLIPEIVVRYRSTYFSHIFMGGYSAGYYSYIWAEVLDKDAFEAFKKNGLFDKETATRFRKDILEKGRSEDAMVLYKKFRGKEPSIEPLLESRGLK